jgi:2-dehydro-3-deoxyphosphogluconate aldolase/(4S)-4-hydroxy-2-oxoglutarate aldolase
VIPVIVLQRVEDAVPLARALVDGGVRVLEVTLRTPVALQCMEAIAKAVPAGDRRRRHGAQRRGRCPSPPGTPDASSPSAPATCPAWAHTCRELGLPLLPGVATSSEVMQANADGYDFLKFFRPRPSAAFRC